MSAFEFVYVLKLEGVVFYCGKTVDTYQRHKQHLNDKSGSPKSVVIQKAIEEGKEIVLEVVHKVPRGCLEGLEDETIQELYDTGHKLTNRISGNKGVQLTAAEAREFNKAIQYHKVLQKPKKGEKGSNWTPERQCEVNANYEAYKRGELSMDDLKRISESRTRME